MWFYGYFQFEILYAYFVELFYLNKLLSISTQLCKWHNVILLKCNRFKYRTDTYFICMYIVHNTLVIINTLYNIWTACKICSINRKYVWLRFQIVDFAWMWCWCYGYKYNYYASLFMNLYQTKWHLIWEQYISCSQRGWKRRSEMRTCYCHSWYFNIQTM